MGSALGQGTGCIAAQDGGPRYFMSRKALVWIGLSIGSLAGGYAPVLWGGDVFSYSALLLSTVGGILGIWLGFTLGE